MSLVFKAVRLIVLSDIGQPICHATGSIIIYNGDARLFTCWHVVTGLDFFEPRITAESWPPARRKLKVEFTKIESLTGPDGKPTDSVQPSQLELDLYQVTGLSFAPLWRQEDNDRPHADLNAVGIKIPKDYDLVQIKIPINEKTAALIGIEWSTIKSTIIPVIGHPTNIVGYPYGYKIGLGHIQFPTVLTRFVASYIVPISYSANSPAQIPDLVNPVYFIDGMAAPGMSGAPMFIDLGTNSMSLIGIYTGCVFPDAALLSTAKERGIPNDRFAALGVACPLSAIQKLLS